MPDVEDLVNNFMTSRKRPEDQYEELKRILPIEGHDVLDEAYKEYRKILQRPRAIVPPYALSKQNIDTRKTWYKIHSRRARYHISTWLERILL